MSIVETYRTNQPRVVFFYYVVALMLVMLTAGLAYRQLLHSSDYTERARIQSQRRLLVPGPRGNLYDREGRLLVGNRPRFAVVLYLAELRDEIRKENIQIVRAYRDSEKEGDIERADRPKAEQFEQIARYTVINRYLDQINRILGRFETLDHKDLERHFKQQLLLPYILIGDLRPEEYARLIERLPVKSPLQVYTSSTRSYPYGSAAAHTLGFVVANQESAPEEFPGEELKTFAMKGTIGRSGLERQFDSILQGETGGAIYHVDPAGFKIEPPLEKRTPVQGRNITLSLDIDLQLAAEDALEGLQGAAAAIDIRTGEILAITSKPDYDLNSFAPRLSSATAKDIDERGAWLNRAIQGAYPPGSTFKIITAMAGLRSGAITPDSKVVCTGSMMVGNRLFRCHNHSGHGEEAIIGALRDSCDVFFYTYGLQASVANIAAEARRFHLDRPTGIELPGESRQMFIPDAEWKQKERGVPWFPGDTANLAIGQGDLQVTPLQMACFMASFARGETFTKPTLIHDPDRPPQHTDPIGLPAASYNLIVNGLEQAVQAGTGKLSRIAGIRIAGKTGTAQKGKLDLAWYIAYAPIDHPEIAIAVVAEGTEPNESYHGGTYACPVAKAVFEKYFAKKNQTAAKTMAAAGAP